MSSFESWLRETCETYSFSPVAIFQDNDARDWPLVAHDSEQLRSALADGGHFISLPKEPAALANILEVSIVDFIVDASSAVTGLMAIRGTERGYPDIEFTGTALADDFVAVDVKIARLRKSGTSTQSAITLYTGNTYFRFPSLHWPGTFRPFQDYALHLDVLGLYRLNESHSRIDTLELVVQEPWKIASRKRSSTTREYLGAVTRVDALRSGKGDFATEAEFYTYWRGYPFKIGTAIERQLKKLLESA